MCVFLKKSVLLKAFFVLAIWTMAGHQVVAQPFMTNVYGREFRHLNGKWQILIDPYEIGRGDWRPFYKDLKPASDQEFIEYSYDNAKTLNVPGDWNSQQEKLLYYEGLIWYKKDFNFQSNKHEKAFLYFGAVNYQADVYLNGDYVGSHLGGFTPFQFEVTDKLKNGNNFLIVAVSNRRAKEYIPALKFDWWNYGGITRDVMLVTTPQTFITDYVVGLKSNSFNQLEGYVKLKGSRQQQSVRLRIPEAKINYQLHTDTSGYATFTLPANISLWSPENPRRYQVYLESETDTVQDMIGFRQIAVKGPDILLNGKSIFLRGVCIHEEIPQRLGRAHSETDARMLLGWAKELGCNFVRLAHYPHNEHMVRLADEMGLMVWSEIPLWQDIDFSSQEVFGQAKDLLSAMISRDKNRCSIIIWSVANETPVKEIRTTFLKNLAAEARHMDNTRLITAAFELKNYEDGTITINDPLGEYLDVLAINEYIGWYAPWQKEPEQIVWKNIYNKPLIMSEFGGEALYGKYGTPTVAHSWSEDYQAELYRRQLRMLERIPFLRGTSPWVLADFRSPFRQHSHYQEGWNRKGLLSDTGQKKKAWYIMHDFYKQKKQAQRSSKK